MIPYAFVWEKVKTLDFSETIVVYDIKVGGYSQLNESFMSTRGQGHSLTLVQITQIIYIFKLFFPQEQLILIYPQYSGERYRTNGPLVVYLYVYLVSFTSELGF